MLLVKNEECFVIVWNLLAFQIKDEIEKLSVNFYMWSVMKDDADISHACMFLCFNSLQDDGYIFYYISNAAKLHYLFVQITYSICSVILQPCLYIYVHIHPWKSALAYESHDSPHNPKYIQYYLCLQCYCNSSLI